MLLLSFHQDLNSSNSLSLSQITIWSSEFFWSQSFGASPTQPSYKLLSIVIQYLFFFWSQVMFHFKTGFLLIWILMDTPPTVSIFKSSFKRMLTGPVLYFPQSQQKLSAARPWIVVCKLAFTLALNWFLLKMDFYLLWGSFLNSGPQNKIFQTTNE